MDGITFPDVEGRSRRRALIDEKTAPPIRFDAA